MAEARIAKVSTLVDPVEWQKWLNFIPEEDREQIVELKEHQLPGFSSYDIPAHRLEKAAKDNLAAVAKIFETINRTGQQLATFDLMVARLYPSNFYLKDEWQRHWTGFPSSTTLDTGLRTASRCSRSSGFASTCGKRPQAKR